MVMPFNKSWLLGIFLVMVAALAQLQAPLTPNQETNGYLSLTAVTSDADSPDARIECWQFSNPFSQYPTVGKALPLADVSNITYVVLPAKSEEGLHHPPSPMLFVLVSGMAHVTLPSSEDDMWIKEWENQVIVANDVHGVGHNTEYPMDRETVALQLPFMRMPDYTVLHGGACGGHT
jgi:hypothetical protein